MLSNFGGFHGLMAPTSANLLEVKGIGKKKGINP
jgi:DNA repair protein RadC